MLMTNYDVIIHADVIYLVTGVGDTCRYVRSFGGTCVCIRYSDA